MVSRRSPERWLAPSAAAPVDALVRLPGSKSQTNRALVLAALADAPTRLIGPLRARDSELMCSAVTALGAQVDDDGADWIVRPAPSTGPLTGAVTGSLAGPVRIDCGLAGTVMRFVPPMAGLASGPVDFHGDAAARRRPMRPLLDALRAVGVQVDGADLPFVVQGAGAVRGGTVALDASASSQFVSGLLLSGARYERGVTVHHDGKQMPSLPHVAMTVGMLRERGVDVDDDEPQSWRVRPGAISGGEVAIEPDLSNAAPFLAAAVVTGGRVVVAGWPAHTTQAGAALQEILELAGAVVTPTAEGLAVQGYGGPRGMDLDLRDAGELAPVLAALAALADGPSHLRGIAHLRGHETDRLAALATELAALGGEVEQTSEGLFIQPRRLHAGVFRTYDDHRLATAGAVLGLAVPGVEVENIGTVAKTMPDFVARWQAMLSRPPVAAP